MTAVLANRLQLTGDQLRVVAARIGIHELPTALASQPRHVTIDEREAALAGSVRELMSRNLFENGHIHADLVSVLQTLQRADQELTMRLVSPDGIARISVARRGNLCVHARRIGDDITLHVVKYSVGFTNMIASLLAELPRAKPADIQPFGAPLREMADGLSDSHDAVRLGDRIRALGAEPRTAILLGSALASRQAFVEIVYSAVDTEGRIRRGPAAVAVFYTKRGRIVGAPSASATGQLWTTLKPGSTNAVRLAIGQLIELADERQVSASETPP